MLDDPAVLYADDVDHVDLDLGTGRLDAVEAPAVASAKDLAGDDLVALGDLVEDLCAEAVERGPEAVELLAYAVRPGRDPRRSAVIEDVRVQQFGEGPLIRPGEIAMPELASTRWMNMRVTFRDGSGVTPFARHVYAFRV